MRKLWGDEAWEDGKGGGYKILLALVDDKLISLDVAAEKSGLTTEELLKRARERRKVAD